MKRLVGIEVRRIAGRSQFSRFAVCRRWLRRGPGTSLLVQWLGVLVAMCCTSFAGDPGQVFQKNCASCHGADGKAQTLTGRKLGVKDLSKSTLNDMQIQHQILEGRPAGQNTARMPAFKDRLTPEEISSLVSLVKSFRD